MVYYVVSNIINEIMGTIITTSDLQKKIGYVVKNVANTTYTVINRGKPKMVLLPYFDDSENAIVKYLQAYKKKKFQIIDNENIKKSLDDIKRGDIISLNASGMKLSQKNLDEKLWN